MFKREKEDIEMVCCYICKNTGKSKLLEEWLIECNQMFPNNRKKTVRELAHMFRVIRLKGLLEVQKIQYPPIYTFLPAHQEVHEQIIQEIIA